MKSKLAIAALLTTALATAPLAPAYAEGHRSHERQNRSDSGLFLGLFAAGLAGTAVALATSPYTLIVETPPPPPPVYVAPAPAYYYYDYHSPIYRPMPSYRHGVVYERPYYRPHHAYAVYR